VIVKNGGGRMLKQPLLMSSALRASARSLCFLMGYSTVKCWRRHFMARSRYQWPVDEDGWNAGHHRILSKWEDWHWRGIYYGYQEIDWPVWLCSGYPMEAREEEDVQLRPGDRHSRRICRRWESAGVVLAEWPDRSRWKSLDRPILRQKWRDQSLSKICWRARQ